MQASRLEPGPRQRGSNRVAGEQPSSVPAGPGCQLAVGVSSGPFSDDPNSCTDTISSNKYRHNLRLRFYNNYQGSLALVPFGSRMNCFTRTQRPQRSAVVTIDDTGLCGLSEQGPASAPAARVGRTGQGVVE